VKGLPRSRFQVAEAGYDNFMAYDPVLRVLRSCNRSRSSEPSSTQLAETLDLETAADTAIE
jgi:hypothetical protein